MPHVSGQELLADMIKAAKLNPESWTAIVRSQPEPRWGKPSKQRVAALWIPPGVETLRGIFRPGGIIIGKQLAESGEFRALLAEYDMAVLLAPGIGGVETSGLKDLLEKLAIRTGHPELPFLPFLTAGHSADGISARNIGYVAPERTLGIIMLKSGNFHHGIANFDGTLAGIPLIHVSGEFEEYGPEGGDMGAGLRSEYVTVVKNANGASRRKNQTQWVMTRMQMLDRRRKNPENLWVNLVERGGNHADWRKKQTLPLLKTWTNAVLSQRVPDAQPEADAPIPVKPISLSDGWLMDADHKTPEHQPAPFDEYSGDKLLAYWVPDETTARAFYDYYAEKPWTHPDPTEGQPTEQRFYPPELLQDLIDAPPPTKQVWTNGSGVWTKDTKGWQSEHRQQSGAESKTACRIRKELARNHHWQPNTEDRDVLKMTGLNVGNGTTFVMQQHRISNDYHFFSDKEVTYKITLHRKSPADAGKRGAYITNAGNAVIKGGTIEVDVCRASRWANVVDYNLAVTR